MRVFLFLAALGATTATASVAATSDVASYPLATCIVSGEVLDTDFVTREFDHREIRFCGEQCASNFKANPEPIIETLDQAIIEAQRLIYPVETCVVSGEPLGGEMGEPVDHLVGNRLVRLCCETCTEKLEADPASFIAALDEAAATAQTESYPATTCPISGGELGSMGDPFDYVFAGTLVRFCCGGCVDAFNADPATALTKVYGGAEAPDTGHDQHDHSDHDH
jgi:YHS domain-containing protein